MNNKVFDYLNEKKDKVVDFAKEKKDDATRYAEERVSAIKEYIEKNGKQIKRSATALALAGLTTLSASTLSGCELPSETTGTELQYYTQPETKSSEDIEKDGITNEDMLALLDNLVWERETKYWDSIEEMYGDKDYREKHSIQFNKISAYSPCGYAYIPDSYDVAAVTHERFENYRLHNFYVFDVLGTQIFEDEGELCKVDEEHYTQNIGYMCICGKAPFEAVANEYGSGKYFLTEEICDNEYGLVDNRFIGHEVYKSFEITRDDVANATPEQLKVLYKLYQSIYQNTMLEDFTDGITAETYSTDSQIIDEPLQ